jgi:hypothetical protein
MQITLFTDGALLTEFQSLIYLQSIVALWRLTQHSTTTGIVESANGTTYLTWKVLPCATRPNAVA